MNVQAVQIAVTVKPGAKVQKIVSDDDGGLTVYLHARAHDGEANVALIKALADYYGVSKSCVEILRGQKSRRKVVLILK
ncbi:DUF167 domain-containing protein [Candidatus Saccharibacteria bacterium]|nr:DUF167 domain-containing protein [Candidatus Saccharibacteria bacterium]